MKKAVGYIKAGRGRKDEAVQREKIAEYCLKRDLEVVEYLRDGYDDFGAVAYGNWMGHKRIDAVVAARAEDVTESVYEFYAYKCKLRMRNSDLVIADGSGYAGYGLYSKMFNEFLDTLCKMELKHEPVRSSTGRIRKATKGGYIGGQPPMGYRVEDGRLTVNEDEAPVVRYIIEQKRAGRTMLGTVEGLNSKGYKTRRGGKFVISTVQGIWNNEKLYQGYYQIKDTGEWVKGQHEAIVK